MSWTKNPDGSRPYFEGWDNPAFINLMLDFFQANAARLAFACYFNRDYAAAADMPASYIAPWAGLEDAATACERQPVGDNNRCGARAWSRASVTSASSCSIDLLITGRSR